MATLAATERGFARVQIDEKKSDMESGASFDFSGLHSDLVETFDSGKTHDLAWRKAQLRQLQLAVKENYEEIAAAIQADHGGPKIRAFFDMDMLVPFPDATRIEFVSPWKPRRSFASHAG